MSFVQQLCDAGRVEEEDSSRADFVAMLRGMPAVEEACAAVAAAVKPLLDSARDCSEVL
jgi:hypothetical protein